VTVDAAALEGLQKVIEELGQELEFAERLEKDLLEDKRALAELPGPAALEEDLESEQAAAAAGTQALLQDLGVAKVRLGGVQRKLKVRLERGLKKHDVVRIDKKKALDPEGTKQQTRTVPKVKTVDVKNLAALQEPMKGPGDPLPFEHGERCGGCTIDVSSDRALNNNAEHGDKSERRCDKCDSKGHASADCPHYRKPRESHPDAQKKRAAHMSASVGTVIVASAKVVHQPGDGSCLFHSVAYGLGDGTSGRMLRRQITSFIAANPNLKVADATLKEWVKWDSNTSVKAYTSRMASRGWGGGIELAAGSRLRKVNIHVYERLSEDADVFKRISCFDCPHATKVVNVLYQGNVHYDALVIPPQQ